MATLTPGVLTKLIANSKNRSIKVLQSQHRSALLQVIEILPSLVNNEKTDPWKNKGFYLKVSDSLNSTYVSVTDKEDIELVFNNKIQLGQFIYVNRFELGTPFPVLRGVKVVNNKCACVGDPIDLGLSSGVDLKKVGVVKMNLKRVGNEDKEIRRLSLDGVRRGWDKGVGLKKNENGNGRFKERTRPSSSDSASVLSDNKASSPRRDTLLKDRVLSNSPLKCKSNSLSLNMANKPLKKDIKTPAKEATIPNPLVKVPLKFQRWSDQSISWDLLPSSIHDSGKDAIRCRNSAFQAAVDALHEASAAESVIRCMSRFAELCESAPRDSPGILIGKFLNVHQSMQRKASVVDALLKARFVEARTSVASSSELSSPELLKVFLDKNLDAESWVQAAVDTDLSKFSLLSKQDKIGNQLGNQCHFVVLEPSPELREVKVTDHFPQDKRSPQNQGRMLDSSAKGTPSPRRRLGHSVSKKTNDENVAWCKGGGLKEVASLVERLLLTSRGWFLKYLEDSLNVGFGLSSKEDDSEVGSLLGQLKRVNQWLEDATGDRFEVDEKVEKLRKKLYGFLLENLDSAIVASR
ncbi:hypothetical protein IFM89_013567 [Coptis chinensis]|uniref:Uncharacterized protein n=1 Tax=Coptis chinensis TaxID=261450 RepID=A0A835I3X9_9MAGN|nr:hypothetical protein IFM89_013567 [Coptis chinensis]